jgi:alkylation response protein AidB-like acyl-CoA dehydrogenase
METANGETPAGQLAETIALLLDSVTTVLEAECDSRAVHRHIDGDANVAHSLWHHAGELGWFAAHLPEDRGGLGLGLQGLSALQAALGRHAAPGPFLPTLCLSHWLAETAGELADPALVSHLSSGEWTGALPAQLGGPPALTLTGGKIRGKIDLFGSPDADLLAAPATDAAGRSCWALVGRGAGVAASPRDGWDRTRAIVTVELDAEPLAVLPDADSRIGRALQDTVAIAVAADSVGAADGIFDRTLEYLKQRVQFERPIASFQAIKHRMASHAAAIETQRHQLNQAVYSLEADSFPEIWVDLCKVGATECFATVAGDCIQLHGGVGHTWEYDPHIYAKRAQLNRALVQRNGVALDAAMSELFAALKAGREVTELPL